MKSCPHCGAALHEGASFCPYCAKPVNARKEVQPPRYIPGRALYSALIVLIAVAVLLFLGKWAGSRPKVYDNGNAEVLYTHQGVDYQLCIAWADAPFHPAQERSSNNYMDDTSRYPVLLYINLADGSAHAADTFLEQVDSIAAEITGADAGLQMTCAQPVHDTDYVPNTAAIVYVNYLTTSLGQHSAELTISVQVKNGDVIRLHQRQIVETAMTRDYTPEDAPMNTVQDLETLMAQIEKTAGPDDEINIHLPPVIYRSELALVGRPVNLIGSEDESGNRTTFTKAVHVTTERGWIYSFDHIDFVGPGEGTGLSISARAHLDGCRIAGWGTGVLAHTNAWVNLDECVVEDNTVGFRFNAATGSPSDTRYSENVFRGNGTAVLLEQVPNEVSLKFPGTLFEGNGQDFDNRCGQALELDETVFRGGQDKDEKD